MFAEFDNQRHNVDAHLGMAVHPSLGIRRALLARS